MTKEELAIASRQLAAQAEAAVATSPVLRDMIARMKKMYGPTHDEYVPLTQAMLATAYLEGYSDAVLERT